MDAHVFKDKLIGWTEIVRTWLQSTWESRGCRGFVSLGSACILHSPKNPNDSNGVLLAKISVFQAYRGQSLCASSGINPKRSLTFPFSNPPSVPSYCSSPSIVMSCCCCSRSGRPMVATASLPPVDSQVAYPVNYGPQNRPVIQRRVSSDAGYRNCNSCRGGNMTPQMFPIIPDPIHC